MTTPQLPSTGPRGQPRSRVLVAAREGRERDRILAVLDELGAQVTEVRSSAELLEAIGQQVAGQGQPPEAIVAGALDEGEGHGLEALRVLRRAGWTTPFVLIDRRHELEARALGAVVLSDPIDVERLTRALRGWLEDTGPWRPADLGLLSSGQQDRGQDPVNP